ncbi:MAG: trypsin-like peptidase domain-containing protein [Holosporaceae bacterium]|nr:trypsin-like peptidase domain-containing protein [Holosporaceae bacterium]
MKYLIPLAMTVMVAPGAARGAIKGEVIRNLIDCVVDVIVLEENDTAADGIRRGSRKSAANGSGFIIDASGFIVTNCHVIDSAVKITISLSDGSVYSARVVGKDEHSDVALLKIEADVKLPSVQFADSDSIEIGEPVIAIGNPLGFGRTVTSGIISYKGRSLADKIAELGAGGDMVSYLQTDAAVSFGNSGGPLFTNKAEVVGMVTVFCTDGLQGTGINFAIPSNTLKKVIKELKVHGKMLRSWLGISVAPLGKRAARAMGLEKQNGYAVVRVDENSPAAVAGLQAGDILTSLNDENISDSTDSELMLSSLPIGRIIPVQIIRHGTEMKLSVTVGIRTDDNLNFGTEDPRWKEGISREEIKCLGICVAELTSDLRKKFDIPDSVKGVLISGVNDSLDDSISVGNVILTINQSSVVSVASLKKELYGLAQKPSIIKTRELAAFVYDPQTRRSQYVPLHFDPTIGVNAEKKSDVSKAKDGVKAKWSLI